MLVELLLVVDVLIMNMFVNLEWVLFVIKLVDMVNVLLMFIFMIMVVM